jgi:DNA-binding NtrC family response regulator
MQKKMLIVDDDLNFINKVMGSGFRKYYSFSIADSLTRARMMMSFDIYDIVLANVKIPGGSSIELKAGFSKESGKTRFIFMSNLDSDCAYVDNLGERCCRKYDFDNSIKVYLANE